MGTKAIMIFAALLLLMLIEAMLHSPAHADASDPNDPNRYQFMHNPFTGEYVDNFTYKGAGHEQSIFGLNKIR